MDGRTRGHVWIAPGGGLTARDPRTGRRSGGPGFTQKKKKGGPNMKVYRWEWPKEDTEEY